MQANKILQNKPLGCKTVSRSTKMVDAMGILIDNKISCLPVTDDQDRIIGIVSDKDIFHAVYKDLNGFKERTINDIMTTKVIISSPEDKIEYIAGLMTQNRVRHIPVIEEEKLVGMISIGDIVKSQIENIKVENKYLRQYIDGSYPG